VKQEKELYAYRRHVKTCRFFGPGGREIRADKCNCPFHADGGYRGERPRKSLGTRNRQIADKQLAELMRNIDARLDSRSHGQPGLESMDHRRTVADSVQRFLYSHGTVDPVNGFRGDVEYGTFRKYRNSLNLLASFCQSHRINALSDVTLEALEDYRQSRAIGLVTWKVELQTLRTFFGYCIRHKWIAFNPANDLKAPRNLKPNEVVPYTLQEESRILAACEQIGGGKYNRAGASYEQLRARVMIMLLRATALRVSDVCTVRKDAVSWDADNKTWRALIRTQKSGEAVYLPIPETLKLALDALPLPRNAAKDCPYYFWNAITSRRAVVGIAERTLAAVFKKSGVKNAHAHRFRHTLATRLLAQGASFERVADILGNSPDVVRKHYGKWSKGRQDGIDELMFAHFRTLETPTSVTNLSHEKTGAVN
jgi:site-specific recombinase XerD